LKDTSSISYNGADLTGNEKGRKRIVLHIMLAWVIVSIMFWIAAYHKPFHVDEFYSWVYVERSSVQEILGLKEFGIGHPPFYYLIQKAVQAVVPGFHPMSVRMANYFIGSACLAALVSMLSEYRDFPAFYYGVASSAVLLDLFVFSRMWGLVCFFSVLLIWAGEKYVKGHSPVYLLTALVAYGMGMFADYSIILLSPYILLVLLSRSRYVKYFAYVMVAALSALWIYLSHISSIRKGYGDGRLFYSLSHDVLKTIFETGLMLFRFWFEEPFLGALLVIALSILISFLIKKRFTAGKEYGTTPRLIMLLFVILISLDISVQNDLLRIRYAAIAAFLMSAVLLLYIGRTGRTGTISDNGRLLASGICALLILVSVSQVFWKDLKHFLYVTPLLPVALLLIYRNLGRVQLYPISFVLLVSGLLYVSSNVIAGYYPPPSLVKLAPIIFRDEFAYSNRYLRFGERVSEEPFLIDQSNFDKFCKTCRMGTRDIPFDKFEKFWIVDRYDSDSHPIVPSGFSLVEEKAVGLTASDKYQFDHFCPLSTWHYATFEYHQTGKGK
jgi:hypothetical protein